MFSVKKLSSNQSGAVIPLVAIMLTTFVLITAVTVDISRVYTAQGKLQNAVDAALLGAVSTASSKDVSAEFMKLFNANFQSDLATVTPVLDAQNEIVHKNTVNGDEIYNVTMSAKTTYQFGQTLGVQDKTFTISSQVTRGFTSTKKLELTLVIEVSKRNESTGAVYNYPYINEFNTAAKDLINNLFTKDVADNITVSIVPHNSGVLLNRIHFTKQKLQGSFFAPIPIYTGAGLPDQARSIFSGVYERALISRALFEGNSYNSWNLYSNTGLLDDGIKKYTYLQSDQPEYTVNPVVSGSPLLTTNDISSGLNKKSDIINKLTAITPQDIGFSRQSWQGILFGWYTLSPQWQGVWSDTNASFPAQYNNPNTKKVMVIFTHGMEYAISSTYSDPTRMMPRDLCTKIKEKGVEIYTVRGSGFTSVTNNTAGCESDANHRVTLTNIPDLKPLVDGVLESTIRLSQ